MKIRHEKENLNKAAIKIESYWPVDPVSDEVEKVFYQEIIQANKLDKHILPWRKYMLTILSTILYYTVFVFFTFPVSSSQLLIDNYCDFDISRTMPGACDEQHRCLLYNGPLRLNEKQGRVSGAFSWITEKKILRISRWILY
jgi:hypothetical protein